MFVLIDLNTQAVAVAKYVQGWRKQQFLSWISQFGEVRKYNPYNNENYLFTSVCGLHTTFSITENNKLLLDHPKLGQRQIKVELSAED